MSDLNQILHQVLRDVVGTFGGGNAGLVEGTNANTIKTATAIDFCIGGRWYSKAATDNIAMTACAQQADGTTCWYLITINAGGTVKITKGGDDDTAQLPQVPANEAVIGAMKIVTSGATFTSGTTDLGASGITDTFYDLAYRPVGVPS